ncbi:MAG: thermonuclease family protein [Candidatus Zixiibacteriota bacterium]|jgi:endonuclease YncB( thermonuclease family)
MKYWRYILLVALLAAGAAGAAEAEGDEEVSVTPPGLEMEAVTARCEEVKAPNLVVVHILGECALIGVQPVGKDEPYYRDALEFVRGKVRGVDVRVEVCPNMPVNEQGQNRAIIYYYEGGKWVNLNIELIRAGLAKVADVPGCHVPTKAWLEYEKEARNAGLGMWTGKYERDKPLSEEPDIGDFD